MPKRKPKVRWWVARDSDDSTGSVNVFRKHRPVRIRYFTRGGFFFSSHGGRCARLDWNVLDIKPGQCVEIEPPVFRKRVKR